jgi:hypothetical protein
MMDLVILLSISLAVTAMLGLLFAGFVWAPWLIGLLLVVLLMVLMKVSAPDDPQVLAQLFQDSELSPLAEQQPTGEPAATSEEDPVMLYRGVKYQRKMPSETPTDAATMTPPASEGKYRGHPWKRPV